MTRIIEFPLEADGEHVAMPVVYEDAPDDASEEVARAFATGLPPKEFRLIDIAREKIPTPINERGIVDGDLLIEEINKTIKPEYRWPGASDKHHGQWRRADYAALQAWSPESYAYSFREMAPNKMLIPRIYHNWIHAVTLEPPMPAPEIMRESVQEWVILKNFFESIQQTTQIMRVFDRARDRREFTAEQEDMLNEELLRKFAGVIMHFEAVETIPLERWPFSPDMRLQIAAGKIGDLVLRGWQRRTRDVRRPDLQTLQKVA